MPGIRFGDKILQFTTNESKIVIDGKTVTYEVLDRKDGRMLVRVGNSIKEFIYSHSDRAVEFYVRGAHGEFTLLTDRDILLQSLNSSSRSESSVTETRAPMPGMVIKVCVNAGDEVKRGAALVILEAMKMENEIRASRDAIVESVPAVAGRVVEKDQLLVVLK